MASYNAEIVHIDELDVGLLNGLLGVMIARMMI